MLRNKKKKIFLCIAVFLFAALCIVALWRRSILNQSGILLSFDDYNAENWESYFDLFDEYDAHVTFFITAYAPTDFCRAATERGHEIACHTGGHVRVPELSEEEFYQQAIAPIEEFRKEGYELTTFSYPYGDHTEETDKELLKYYKTLRGAFRHDLHQKISFKNAFVESKSIDNVNYQSDEEYEKTVIDILQQARDNKRAISSFYSHAIGGGDWNVSEERLEFLLKTAKEYGLKFYTYKDLQ